MQIVSLTEKWWKEEFSSSIVTSKGWKWGFFLLFQSNRQELLLQVIFGAVCLINLVHICVGLGRNVWGQQEEDVGLKEKMESHSVFYQKYILAPHIDSIWKLHLKRPSKKRQNPLNSWLLMPLEIWMKRNYWSREQGADPLMVL